MLLLGSENRKRVPAEVQKENEWVKRFHQVPAIGSRHMLIQLDEEQTLDDIFSYLRKTPGIGGFQEHTLMFSTKFCREKIDLKYEGIHATG